MYFLVFITVSISVGIYTIRKCQCTHIVIVYLVLSMLPKKTCRNLGRDNLYFMIVCGDIFSCTADQACGRPRGPPEREAHFCNYPYCIKYHILVAKVKP